jgi:hypothetical protein
MNAQAGQGSSKRSKSCSKSNYTDDYYIFIRKRCAIDENPLEDAALFAFQAIIRSLPATPVVPFCNSEILTYTTGVSVQDSETETVSQRTRRTIFSNDERLKAQPKSRLLTMQTESYGSHG